MSIPYVQCAGLRGITPHIPRSRLQRTTEWECKWRDPLCDAAFPHLHALWRHVRQSHGGRYKQRCFWGRCAIKDRMDKETWKAHIGRHTVVSGRIREGYYWDPKPRTTNSTQKNRKRSPRRAGSTPFPRVTFSRRACHIVTRSVIMTRSKTKAAANTKS
ncbi:hypothetical protein BZA77DRAFT_308033 [Pyronema omphalodes]|nr:hypothetical protein BZA77DRAFT_324226 [Pyronema omphalodes]KAI5817945.1 hypothetical protein BZA77DRAFT_308033 [Pyronema omphalodes]